MGAYLVRRALQLLLVVWAALTVIFFLFFLLPGDPAELLSGSDGKAPPPAVLERINERLGLDQPVTTQYVKYMKRVVRWDLGESFKTPGKSVNDIFNEKAKNSLRLGFWAIVVEVSVGLSAGVYSAVRKYSVTDTFISFITIAASATPVYVLGLLFQRMLGVLPNQQNWPAWTKFPTGGLGPDSWFLFVIPTGHQWKYVVLPAITLASVSTALVARMMRATMIENERSDYIRTARAKGLPERRILVKHVMRNAMIPVVTLIAIDVGTIIGVAVLTETVFSWPGIGSEIAQAVLQRDFSIILGLSIVVVLLYAVANLLADITYALLDPRIRLGGKGAQR